MKIIGISGRKQSGKNTVANFINGSILKNRDMINDYYLDEDGSLVISTLNSDGESGYGIFDVTRKDKTFIDYAEQQLWPYVKVYHFADPLKEMSIHLFGLNPNHVYGNDNDKNKLTSISWESLPTITDKKGYLTVREFLEYFGTKIVRKLKYDAWSKFTINKVLAEQSELAIIPDVRFPNEVSAIKDAGGIVIRLTRNIFNSTAEAETALDKEVYDWNNFDLVIDNQDTTLEQLCELLKFNSRIWSI